MANERIVRLLPHQKTLLSDTRTRYEALVAGFGAGKTFSLVHKAIQLAYINAGTTGILLEPSYPLIHDILIPVLDAELLRLGIPYDKRVTPNVNYVLHFGASSTTLLLRSFENWQRLIGVNASFIGVDEIDTVRKDVALKAWRKLQGRLRAGKVRQMFTTSTPEGFGFLYEWFYKQKKPDRRLIKAKTTDNPYLPADFIESLYSTYPENLIDAYINGEFVNLQSGTVYRSFDRDTHNTSATVEAGETVHVGVDFNIEHMSAVVHVIRDGKFYAVDELVDLYDTFEFVDEIKRRYWPKHKIIVYPDASSRQRHSSASQTDLTIMRKAELTVLVDKRNPSVRDRVTAMNAAFKSALGEVSYFVNVEKCPSYTEALEQLAYRNGEPDKSSGYDHITDAAGYFIWRKFQPKRQQYQRPIRSYDDRYIKAVEEASRQNMVGAPHIVV